MNNGDTPANAAKGFEDELCGNIRGQLHHGLTKREHFAGLAMQGYIRDISQPETPCINVVVNLAVAFADALLKELSK